MKNTEFKNFVSIINERGFEDNVIQCNGTWWFALTDKQISTIYNLAIEKGYTPAEDGTIKIGAWIVSNTNSDIKEIPAMAQKKEEKKEVANTTPETPAVDEKKLNACVERISKQIDKISDGYIKIIGDVAYIYEHGVKALGYKNIYDLCKDKFGMARGSVHNLLSIYEHFGDGNYALLEEHKGRSIRSMLDEIKNEKDARAALAENGGADNDEDEDGEDTDKNVAANGKRKKELNTIVDFDFSNLDAWTIDDLFDKMREELEAAGINEVKANSNIIFKIAK